MHSLTDTGTYNLMDHSKILANHMNRTFAVMQSHIDTSGSNVMAHIQIKNFHVSCIDYAFHAYHAFLKKD